MSDLRDCTGVTIAFAGDTTHVTVIGRIVHGESSAEFFLDAISRAVRRTTRLIVIDLGNVRKMDAAGIGALAIALSNARDARIDLVLANTPGFVRDLLHLFHLDTIFWPPPAVAKGEYDEAA